MRVNIIENADTKEIFAEIHCREITAEVNRLKAHIENYAVRIKGEYEKEAVYVDLKDILYFESVDSKTFIYTKERVLTAELRLYEIEKRLSEKKGFSLAETLIAVMIVLLVSIVVAAGMPAAKDAYYKVIFGNSITASSSPFIHKLIIRFVNLKMMLCQIIARA